MHKYDTATLCCPHCGTYLLDHKTIFSKKSRNSCGYACDSVDFRAPPEVIAATAGDGISPIIDRPELLRPEERPSHGKKV
jgi:ribosomal protein S27AE